jgi:sulfur carrier protein ThiS
VKRNGRFVHAREYGSVVVAGDEIEFIHPNFGG